MIEADGNHCRIVEESLSGERAVDEQTFASIAVLDERLKRLKKLDETFDRIEFSPAVKRLKKQKRPVTIG